MSTIAVAKSKDSQHTTNIEESSAPIAAGSLTFLQEADNDAHKLCSALLSESLFDVEEDSPSNQMRCGQIPASTEESYGSECAEVANDAKFPGSSTGLSIQESHVISSRNDKEFVDEELLLEVGDDKGTSLASADSDIKTENSGKPSQYASLINRVSEDEKISGSSSATLGDSFGNKENEISSAQTVDLSLPVISKVANDSDFDEEYNLSEHPSKPVPYLSGSSPERSPMISGTESSLSVPKESITEFRIGKPITNDMPIRDEPMFSTVVSVSPELASPYSSVSLSGTCDLDTLSGSSEENRNSNDATIEENTKTREICSTAESLQELPQTADATRMPSVVEVGDDLEAVSSIHEYSDAGENLSGEPSMGIEESQRLKQ